MHDFLTVPRITLLRMFAAGLMLAGSACAPNDQDANVDDGPRIEDRMMIDDLTARYVILLDSSDIDGYISLFTDDATLNVNNIDLLEGKPAIRAMMDGMQAMMAPPGDAPEDASGDAPSFGPMRHVVTSQVIDFEGGDRAIGQSFWMEIMSNGPDVPPSIFNMGRYEDVFVKRDGEWLIQYRLAVADMGYVPDLTGLMPPAPAN